MGGNATASVGTTRKSAAEYNRIVTIVLSELRSLFPTRRILPIIAYQSKESFGDADILVESNDLPPNWIELVKERFMPHIVVRNGEDTSFDFCGMQIDLKTSSSDAYNFAYSYFAYNDLGNLMGRIAHKMGFKYGHNGLWRTMRDGTHMYAEVLVSRDVQKVMEFLGYSYTRFFQGFETLEDVFMFAASTLYFHRDIYQLDNRNHISRIRDIKRPNYNGFLKWIEDKPELDKYTWYAYTGDAPNPERELQKASWNQRALIEFPEYATQYFREIEKHALRIKFKHVWNGEFVALHSGIPESQQLGQFMAFCKKQPSLSEGCTFEEWILASTEVERETFVKTCKSLFDME